MKLNLIFLGKNAEIINYLDYTQNWRNICWWIITDRYMSKFSPEYYKYYNIKKCSMTAHNDNFLANFLSTHNYKFYSSFWTVWSISLIHMKLYHLFLSEMSRNWVILDYHRLVSVWSVDCSCTQKLTLRFQRCNMHMNGGVSVGSVWWCLWQGQRSVGTSAVTTMAESFEEKLIDQVHNYLHLYNVSVAAAL